MRSKREIEDAIARLQRTVDGVFCERSRLILHVKKHGWDADSRQLSEDIGHRENRLYAKMAALEWALGKSGWPLVSQWASVAAVKRIVDKWFAERE